MMHTPAARPAPTVSGQTSSTSANWVVMAISAIGGFFAVRLLPGALAVRIAGGIMAGALVGLVPFAVAKSRGDSRFGQMAMTWCIVSGALLGILLAAPVALGFTIAATRRTPSSAA